MTAFATWRSRPVFITSTFRDMQAERDWLHNHVFPALEERLRERFHHLETIDLRWGVDSAAADEEQREAMVLTVRLSRMASRLPSGSVDHSNPTWQRDLVVSYFKLATLLAGTPMESEYWQCLVLFARCKRRICFWIDHSCGCSNDSNAGADVGSDAI